MRRILLFLFAALLLGAGPAWAFSPFNAVVVPVAGGGTTTSVVVTSGQTTTFTGAPNRGTGANTSYNNNYYTNIEIQSGGTGIFNDGENVQTLTVRTGGILRFGAAGEISSATVANGFGNGSNITLEPGALVQLANPSGLPFATGYYNVNNPGNSDPISGNVYTAQALPPYVITGTDVAYYTFNGSAAQTTAAPAPATRGGGSTPTSSGMALAGTVRRLTNGNTGSSGLTLANATSISQELHLGTNGTLTVGSGGTLTLLSTSAGTALIDNKGNGVINGTLTVQRYIDGTRNASAGYRHLSSPLYNLTVASFANGSFTPSVNPAYNANPASVPAASFPTVFGYDETKVGGSVGTVGFDQGWQSPAALTTPLELAQGYTVNMPAQGTLSFTSTLFNFPSIGSPRLKHTAAAGGWALLGNPYAAPLDWDGVSAQSTGLNKTLYVFKSSGKYAGTYTTYLPGAPAAANTGTNVVPVGQAFFLYNPTQGTDVTIDFARANTITSYDATAGTPVQRPTAEARPYLALTLQDAAATQAHQTLVYFDAAATATGLDNQYDSPYLAGPGQPLSISTALAGQEYATNGLPALGAADVAVPLHLSATATGTYQLQVAALENLPAGTHAYLLDAATGTRQDLATTPRVSIALAANASTGARYSLLFTSSIALVTAPAALAQLASLYPNPAHGTATLVLPATLRAGQPAPVEIVNALGQVVRRATHPATADELALPLDGLAAGLYTVQARTAAGTISRRLTVE